MEGCQSRKDNILLCFHIAGQEGVADQNSSVGLILEMVENSGIAGDENISTRELGTGRRRGGLGLSTLGDAVDGLISATENTTFSWRCSRLRGSNTDVRNIRGSIGVGSC